MTSILKALTAKAWIPAADLVRRLPEAARWVRTGCTGVAPAPLKRMVLSAYSRRYGLRRFIETGTHLGDTLAYIASLPGMHATSIELAESCFRAAKQRFAGYPNVVVLRGDSGALMPGIVQQLDTPTLFWLDGHYSGGDTGKAEVDTPIGAELEAILKSPVRGHVVLIDDARLFNGRDGYPHLDRLLERVRATGQYDAEVSTDIIRLTPRP